MMKNAIMGAMMMACSVVGAAETISFSVPVLSVNSNGENVLPGSGKVGYCPFSFVGSTNRTPVRVSIVEDMPSGAGHSLRASAWLAVTTASLILNRDLAGAKINFETTGYVDGPSAGGMLCLAVMSAMEGRSFPTDFVMTGAIMADGTIGPVGGIAEKIRAASKAGIKRVCIPSFTRMDGDFTDLLDLGKSLDVEMHQVSTVADAFQILHRLPGRQVERLNPLEVCRMSSPVEMAMKDFYLLSCRDLPSDNTMWNSRIRISIDEFISGFFGAAVMNVMNGLEECSAASIFKVLPDANTYPLLQQELQTNSTTFVGKLMGKKQSTAGYVEALKAFYRDLKALESGANDDLEEDSGEEKTAPIKQNDWFDDFVESPAVAQLRTIGNTYFATRDVYAAICNDIDRKLEEAGDWSALSVEGLNDIRSALLDRYHIFLSRKEFEIGGERFEIADILYRSIKSTIPYIRPNLNVQQVEDTFYRTMKAMDAAAATVGVKETALTYVYRAYLNMAEQFHMKAESEGCSLDAVFSEAQALSAACALSVCVDPAVAANTAFFGSVVTTARENALTNIAECRKLNIPCVTPVICFQLSETMRDTQDPNDAIEETRFGILAGYLEASLYAKALVLCFKGQRPELNEKGYCCKSMSVNPDGTTVTHRYLGVDGNPVLRDGYSGYTFDYEGDKEICRSWLDIDGRAVKVKSTNECWMAEYDAAGRQVRKTYCDESWKPRPNTNGVLYENFCYDADGNNTLWEFFGASSNWVLSAEGVAIVKSQYNKNRQEIRRRFFGVKCEAVAHKDGNAGLDFVYDKRGNLRKIIYVDTKGKPVVTTRGYAKEERNYDAQGHEIESGWYDAQGKPVNVNGVSKLRHEYDERGNAIVVSFFDADNKLARNSEGYAVGRWTYDNGNAAVECHYYGPDNKPALHRDGLSSWKAVYDASGRIVGRKFYDLNGNEVDIGAKASGAGQGEVKKGEQCPSSCDYPMGKSLSSLISDLRTSILQRGRDSAASGCRILTMQL